MNQRNELTNSDLKAIEKIIAKSKNDKNFSVCGSKY